MRKFTAIAIAGCLAIGLVSFAVADESVQTEVAKMTPNKLDKRKYKPIKFFNDISTFPNTARDPNLDQPPSAERTVLDFPKNMKFDTSAVPKCNVSSAGIEGTTTDEAKAACGEDSVVSIDPSFAHVTVDTDPNAPGSATFPVEVDVTAFNGKEKDTLYLHSKPTGSASGIPPNILIGKLKDSNSGDQFGKALDVTIPELAAGAIDDFVVTVKAGKYVQARCKSKSNTWRATTYFDNQPYNPNGFDYKVSDDFKKNCKRK